MKINQAEERILHFLGGMESKWVSLIEIAKIRILEDDDIDWIPSLVHKKFLDHDYSLKTVRITDAGRAALAEHDKKEASRWSI